MKPCIIYNPAARMLENKRLNNLLETLSGQCIMKPTNSVGDGKALAAQAVKEGYETIIAAGGDGTINEVINGIGEIPEEFGRVRLGVLPCGTANTFARELKLPLNISDAWKIIKNGNEKKIDLIRAEFYRGGVASSPQNRYFVQLAGAGLDSLAVDCLDLDLKNKIGVLAYVVAGIKTMRKNLPEITASNGQHFFGGEMVLIGNGQFYGGSFRLFPKADAQDGLMDVTVFRQVNLKTILQTGWGLLTNRLYSLQAVKHFKAEKLHLSCSSKMPLQLEGENVGFLPASFFVRRQLLRVIVPG